MALAMLLASPATSHPIAPLPPTSIPAATCTSPGKAAAPAAAAPTFDMLASVSGTAGIFELYGVSTDGAHLPVAAMKLSTGRWGSPGRKVGERFAIVRADGLCVALLDSARADGGRGSEDGEVAVSFSREGGEMRWQIEGSGLDGGGEADKRGPGLHELARLLPPGGAGS
jgi:hypothetical protein